MTQANSSVLALADQIHSGVAAIETHGEFTLIEAAVVAHINEPDEAESALRMISKCHEVWMEAERALAEGSEELSVCRAAVADGQRNLRDAQSAIAEVQRQSLLFSIIAAVWFFAFFRFSLAVALTGLVAGFLLSAPSLLVEVGYVGTAINIRFARRLYLRQKRIMQDLRAIANAERSRYATALRAIARQSIS